MFDSLDNVDGSIRLPTSVACEVCSITGVLAERATKFLLVPSQFVVVCVVKSVLCPKKFVVTKEKRCKLV